MEEQREKLKVQYNFELAQSTILNLVVRQMYFLVIFIISVGELELGAEPF